jgi:hypothetical protein
MNDSIYEVLDSNGAVVNRIILNNPTQWTPPEGHTTRLFVPNNELTPEVPDIPQPLTQLAFLRRFTAPERIGIRASTDPIIQDFLQLVALAQDIQTSDPDTQMGIGYLAQQGLIAPERVAEILA